MTTLILSKNAHALRKNSSFIRLSPSFHATRAASVNSGISRGLRRSKGVGFRTQGRPRDENSDYPATSVIRRSGDPPFFKSQITRDGWRGGRAVRDSLEVDTRASGARIRRGKKDIKPERDAPRFSSFPRERGRKESALRTPTAFDQPERRRNSGEFGRRRSAYGNQVADEPKHRSAGRFRATLESRSQGSRSPSDPSGRSRAPDSRTAHDSPRSEGDDAASSRPRPATSFDKRMPLSIPYTTPASEFLYGTSVVEAALNSQREPRRKLYKLYIYTGESREKVDPSGLERLARRKGIEVARVGMDWLRVLDKMSAGRPHNGYILEASPLPRPPIAHLGEVVEEDGERGFAVSVEHQSREEAAVNGTADFIKLPKSGRKPLVLFLDSIEDPGNLGGIIRTASFLGVTAVAYSVRNSASFTPIVLKASAGASENVTLFAVNKPAGFIAGSKQAGWKIYAAVAPSKSASKSKAPNTPTALSTDELQNPLSQDPCILMLGGEGEGLRTILRNKADVNLSIRGRGPRHNVDSLNVSVAAGILCDAFLRRNQATDRAGQPAKDLF